MLSSCTGGGGVHACVSGRSRAAYDAAMCSRATDGANSPRQGGVHHRPGHWVSALVGTAGGAVTRELRKDGTPPPPAPGEQTRQDTTHIDARHEQAEAVAAHVPDLPGFEDKILLHGQRHVAGERPLPARVLRAVGGVCVGGLGARNEEGTGGTVMCRLRACACGTPGGAANGVG